MFACRPFIAAMLLFAAAGLGAVDTAPAPRVVPPPGVYPGPVLVQALLTPPIAGAVIRFTLDGGEPTATSPAWTTPWLVTDPTVIRLRTFAPRREPSAVVVARYDARPLLTAKRPVMDPVAGTYPGAIAVRLSCATPGAAIRYTTNGSLPGLASPLYVAPIAVGTSTTIQARAFGGYIPVSILGRTVRLPAIFPSGVSSATYVIAPVAPPAAAPTAAPAGGTHDEPLTVTLSTTTANAVIRFTRDGSEPGPGSEAATGPVTLAASGALTARAFAPGFQPSALAQFAYVLRVRPCTIAVASGVHDREIDVGIVCPTAGAVIRCTFDGSDPQESSPAVINGSVRIHRSSTLRVRAFAPWLEPSVVASATYILICNPPTLTPSSGTYADVTLVTATTVTAEAALRFTSDGSAPSALSPLLSPSGVAITATGTRLRVIATREGWTASPEVEALYALRVADPFVDPPTGTRFADGVEIIGASPTPGSVVRVTLDGTAPLASSPEVPVVLRAAGTARLRAFRTGFEPSAIISASYRPLPRCAFAVPTSAVTEGGTASVRLVLSEPADVAVEIGYDIARIDPDGDGLLSTDIGNLGGLAVIAAGETTVDIPVPTVADALDEHDEAFSLTMLTITNAAVDSGAGRHVLTVTDDDATPTVSFATPLTSVDETAGSVSVPLRLSAPSGRPVSVRVTITRATARIGLDLAPAALDLTFAPGAIAAEARFAVYDDTWPEGVESAWLDVAVLDDAAVGAAGGHRIDLRSDESDSVVARWLERACAEVARHHGDPPAAARIYALVGAAQRRAVRELVGQSDLTTVSEAGAVAAAAATVLGSVYPDAVGDLATALTEDRSAPGWSGFTDEAVGPDSFGGVAAAAVLAEAAGDGAIDFWTLVPPTAPGSWYASWAYPQPPLRPWWGTVRPWFLTSGSALRPPPPPAFGSSAFLAAVAEVRAISDRRTDEQVLIAAKWSDGPGTSTPPGHWMSELAGLLRAKRMGESEGAESAALLGAVMHDAAVACWDIKYAYWLLRPYQADRSILSLLGQPNFPAYVSGHATFSAAAAEILAAKFPTEAGRVRADATEAAVSRLYGGIHYRFDNEAGLTLGRAVAAAALADVADGSWARDQAPSVVITAPAPGIRVVPGSVSFTARILGRAATVARSGIVVHLTAADGTPVVIAPTLVEDGGTWLVSTSAMLGEGIYTARFSAIDANGRTAEVRVVVAVDGDGPPVVTIDAPAVGTVSGIEQPVTVRGRISQPVAALTVNGVGVVPAPDMSFAVDLAADPFAAQRAPLAVMGGINEVAVRAVDRSGLVGERRFEILVDDQRPAVRIEAPVDGGATDAATIIVSGRVQDVVLGRVDSDDVAVMVNGVVAAVRGGTFLAQGIPLSAGSNPIEVVAIDRSGNRGTHTITVVRAPVRGLRVAVVDGNGQEATPRTALAAPLRVRVTDQDGAPRAGVAVTFHVARGDGHLAGVAGRTVRSRAIVTGPDGESAIAFTLGGNAGLGNQRVEAIATGAERPAVFSASVATTPADRLHLFAGDRQSGVASALLPQPIELVASDAYGNPAAGAVVEVTIVAGGGGLKEKADSGLAVPTMVLTTDVDGRITAHWQLGSDTSAEGQRLEARLVGVPDRLPVTMVATAVVSTGRPADTALSGIVLEDGHQPIAGVTIVVDGSTIGAVSGVDGRFLIRGAPAGHRHLIVNGATANHGDVRYPTIGFEVDLLLGSTVELGLPINLPRMDRSNETLAGGDEEVVLALPGLPGAEIIIAPHSTIRADGTRGPVWMYTSAVNGQAIPMPLPGGYRVQMAQTLQPTGTRLDPPARMRWPNVDGLPAGFQTPLLSFDHDLGEFVSQGTMTVAEDGLSLLSDPGTGLVKAGWHVAPPPPLPAGNVEGREQRVLVMGVPGLGRLNPIPAEMFAGGMITVRAKEERGLPLPSLVWTVRTSAEPARVVPEIISRSSDGREITVRFGLTGPVDAPIHPVTIRVAPATPQDNGPVPVDISVMPLVQRLIAVDGNRDGTITFDDADATTPTRPWRWWVNDDSDRVDRDIDSRADLPGGGKNHRDLIVNGRRDLVDWFPIIVDIPSVLRYFPVENGYQYDFVTDLVNMVSTDKDANAAMDYLTKEQAGGYGPGLDEAAHMATAVSQSQVLPPAMIAARSQMLLAEGAFVGAGNIVLQVKKGGRVVFEDKIAISISPVEAMYRWLNLRDVVDGGGLPDRTGEPVNRPDSECTEPNLVWVHGYNVGAEGARLWHAEVFKRLYQTGMKARYTGVTWAGEISDVFIIGRFVADYHLASENSVRTGKALAERMSRLPGTKILGSHSMGAGVIGSAIADYGMQYESYLMLNAAMPLEAYDTGHPVEWTMVDPKWREGEPGRMHPERLWAANWYQLFQEGDSRRGLTWRGRFGALPNTTSFYSLGEEVLQASTGSVPPLLTTIEGRSAWQVQEWSKGQFVYLGLSSVPSHHPEHGGWGYNRGRLIDLEREPNGRRTRALLVAETNGEIAEQSFWIRDRIDRQLMELTDTERVARRPFHRLFDIQDDLVAATGQQAATEHRSRLLAQAVPAITNPAGGSSFRAEMEIDQFDMNANRNGWPGGGDHETWFHSDIKNVAYQYIYPTYRELVRSGGLK